jgi:hypothetical protein
MNLEPRQSKVASSTTLWIWGGLWILAVGVAGALLMRYEYRPGRTGLHPAQWPKESVVHPARDRPTLLLFSHPRCPCTRASLEELARLLARVGERVQAHVILRDYDSLAADPEFSDLWRQAASIPFVTVRADPGGRESGLFGAETSGHVVLYDRDGQLTYSGGITSSRGHVGDNLGRSTLKALIFGEPAAVGVVPVFGCPLETRLRRPERKVSL